MASNRQHAGKKIVRRYFSVCKKREFKGLETHTLLIAKNIKNPDNGCVASPQPQEKGQARYAE